LKNYLILLLFLLIFTNISYWQNKVYFEKEVDEQASFSGGNDSLQKFIKSNIIWPDNQISGPGTVIMCFVVDKRGKIKNIKVCHSIFWKSFENEASRIVNLMPKWKPAVKNNKKVCQFVLFPIRFQIEGY
jgi:periplasmic protein TonB